MTARTRIAFLQLLIRDTFRQARASGISLMMLTVTAVCAALCLSVSISGDLPLDADEPVYFLPNGTTHVIAGKTMDGKRLTLEEAKKDGIDALSGRMTLAFGAITIPVGRDRRDAVQLLELILAGGVAGTFGLLLALVWTAGFVPTFLEPAAASVLFAKPLARWHLLMGKYLGVMTFVAVQVSLFILLTWLALGIRTHVWTLTYWWSIPLLMVQFASFYSFSILVAVMARSTVACVFGVALFWCLAWGVNYGVVMACDPRQAEYLFPSAVVLMQGAYWFFPKPIDAGLIFFNVLDATHHFQKPHIFQLLESETIFSTTLSLVTSLFFSVIFLGVSALQLEATDY